MLVLKEKLFSPRGQLAVSRSSFGCHHCRVLRRVLGRGRHPAACLLCTAQPHSKDTGSYNVSWATVKKPSVDQDGLISVTLLSSAVTSS